MTVVKAAICLLLYRDTWFLCRDTVALKISHTGLVLVVAPCSYKQLEQRKHTPVETTADLSADLVVLDVFGMLVETEPSQKSCVVGQIENVLIEHLEVAY